MVPDSIPLGIIIITIIVSSKIHGFVPVDDHSILCHLATFYYVRAVLLRIIQTEVYRRLLPGLKG